MHFPQDIHHQINYYFLVTDSEVAQLLWKNTKKSWSPLFWKVFWKGSF